MGKQEPKSEETPSEEVFNFEDWRASTHACAAELSRAIHQLHNSQAAAESITCELRKKYARLRRALLTHDVVNLLAPDHEAYGCSDSKPVRDEWDRDRRSTPLCTRCFLRLLVEDPTAYEDVALSVTFKSV